MNVIVVMNKPGKKNKTKVSCRKYFFEMPTTSYLSEGVYSVYVPPPLGGKIAVGTPPLQNRAVGTPPYFGKKSVGTTPP